MKIALVLASIVGLAAIGQMGQHAAPQAPQAPPTLDPTRPIVTASGALVCTSEAALQDLLALAAARALRAGDLTPPGCYTITRGVPATILAREGETVRASVKFPDGERETFWLHETWLVNEN